MYDFCVIICRNIITKMNIDAFVPVDVVVSDSDITSNGLYTIMCYRAMVTAQAMNASGKVVHRMFEVHVESCDNDDCDIIAGTAAVAAIRAINADVEDSFDITGIDELDNSDKIVRRLDVNTISVVEHIRALEEERNYWHTQAKDAYSMLEKGNLNGGRSGMPPP
jgi:hypothetical protein